MARRGGQTRIPSTVARLAGLRGTEVRMRLHGILVGAFGALLFAPPAAGQSAATSTATIDNFGYQLIDLAPGDGIAPSVRLSSGERHAEANLYSYPERVPIVSAHGVNYSTVAVSAGGSTARASLAALQPSSDVAAVTAIFSEAYAYDTLDFVLSPHARLIFSGDAHVAVQQNLASNVFASAKIFGEIPSSPLLSTGSQFSSMLQSALGENAQMLSVVVNSGVDELTGYVQVRTDAQAVSRVPAIPEPPRALLLCAGLGLLTLARARCGRMLADAGGRQTTRLLAGRSRAGGNP
jgi:hypothetical protein